MHDPHSVRLPSVTAAFKQPPNLCRNLENFKSLAVKAFVVSSTRLKTKSVWDYEIYLEMLSLMSIVTESYLVPLISIGLRLLLLYCNARWATPDVPAAKLILNK
ncbi:transmembrane protein, putative [Medicago truncatula]|uniref:Transmembrane protein, putative n=1 Tax=Medicago truncatula TaxID=3880 RepID=A0A072V266_MEDTR|nr:transmembrane protein, putative [Medicago truncatula]